MTIQWDERGVAEDCPIVLMDRVKNAAGSYVTQSSLTSLTYKVYACTTKDDVISGAGDIVGTQTTCVIGDTVFDTLQTAAPWSKDATGYNVKIELPPSARPAPGWHRVEITYTPTTGSAYVERWGIKTGALAGS